MDGCISCWYFSPGCGVQCMALSGPPWPWHQLGVLLAYVVSFSNSSCAIGHGSIQMHRLHFSPRFGGTGMHFAPSFVAVHNNNYMQCCNYVTSLSFPLKLEVAANPTILIIVITNFTYLSGDERHWSQPLSVFTPPISCVLSPVEAGPSSSWSRSLVLKMIATLKMRCTLLFTGNYPLKAFDIIHLS